MFLKLFLLFVTVPLIELSILLVLGSESYGIGLLPTLAIVICTGVAGAWLAQWQGTQALLRVRQDLGAGRMPTDAVTDAVLIFFAGAFLMTPGVLTDLLGFTLLVPPGRKLVKRLLVRWFKAQFNIQAIQRSQPRTDNRRDRVIDSHVVESSTAAEQDTAEK